MTFDDFLPFVLPNVSGCPRETALHHIRQAAIEFCDRTSVWREQFDTVLADGFSRSYAMPLDDQVELVKLLIVEVQDGPDARKCEATIRNVLQGNEWSREGDTELIAWTDTRRDVFISPIAREDARIDVYAALKPSQTAFSFPDDVWRHHVKHISDGALAGLYQMTKTDWTDQPMAIVKRGEFEDHIGVTARIAERGFARRVRSPRERFM